MVVASANVAHSQAVLGTLLKLVADGTVVATINGSTFSWANQAGASVVSSNSKKMLTITQSAHPNTTNQAVLATRMALGAACYATYYQNPNAGSSYSSGMFLQNAASGSITVFQDIYPNGAGSNILVGTEKTFQGDALNYLTPYGSYAAFLSNAQFFLRICTDGVNVTFGASPTGLANSFQIILTTTLLALGNPDHVGFFEDANPVVGQSDSGVMLANLWQASATNTPQAKAPGGDRTNSFLTSPNFPVSDNAPIPAPGVVPSLPGRLSLSAGAVYKAYYDFTPHGNVNNRTTLDSDVYYQHLYGNQYSIIGTDGIEGDISSNWSQPRLYPAGDPFNVLNFTPSGLNTGTTCSQNNTAPGCTKGHMYGTLVRFPTAIQKGDIVHVRMQSGNDPLWYQGFVLYSGTMKTPGPGGNPYDPKLGPNPLIDQNCYGEDDLFEGYRYSADWAIGTTLKLGVIPTLSYAQNANGECFKTAPFVQYAANGPNFGYVPAGANSYTTKPLWHLLNTTTYGAMHDYVAEILDDGTNRIRYYFDGYLVATEYYEQSPTTPGWFLELANQTVANFNPELAVALSGVTPNKPIKGGSFSATYSLIEVIHGTVSAIGQPLDTNGASPNGDPIGLN